MFDELTKDLNAKGFKHVETFKHTEDWGDALVREGRLMAISYNQLGSNGRLGNQMFQYAGLRGIAANRGLDWLIPPRTQTVHVIMVSLTALECNQSKMRILEGTISYLTTCFLETFHFDKDLYNNCQDNINLNDYFQTEKYFTNVANDISVTFHLRMISTLTVKKSLMMLVTVFSFMFAEETTLPLQTITHA